jgi:hypothetical protein
MLWSLTKVAVRVGGGGRACSVARRVGGRGGPREGVCVPAT